MAGKQEDGPLAMVTMQEIIDEIARRCGAYVLAYSPHTNRTAAVFSAGGSPHEQLGLSAICAMRLQVEAMRKTRVFGSLDDAEQSGDLP